MKPVTIDVFSDVVCPWCFIGTERLDRAIESLGLSKEVTVRHHAFMLRPDTPEAGSNIHEELSRKYGADPKTLFARVEVEAKTAGIPLDLSKQPLAFATARAHTLLRHAEAKGTQSALSRALFNAYFLEAKNISDLSVLIPLASAHGFTADEATALLQDQAELALSHQESDEAHRQGITGVPFFVFDEKFAVSGGQQESVFRDALTRAVAER